jgi:3-methyladenine DNA glycosylase AlkD
LQLAYQTSKLVKDFLRDVKKLTQKDSKKVKNLFVEINRNSNIKEIKRILQLVVKWIANEKEDVTLDK